MTHKELVDLSHKFVLKNMSCGFAVKELKTTCKEIVDVIGFGAWNYSLARYLYYIYKVSL